MFIENILSAFVLDRYDGSNAAKRHEEFLLIN